jgi:5-methylcytosine-specific restriction endonuclease McrA
MAQKIKILRHKADKVMQEYYRKQDLKCEGCGQPAVCMHHFFTKSSAASLRYYGPNLVAVCQGCHLRHHNGDPRLHAAVVQKRQAGWYDDLLKQKDELIRPSIKYYEAIIKKYQVN